MKKAIIITSIIALASLLAVIGFGAAVAVSGAQMVIGADYSEVPKVAENIIGIIDSFVPGINISNSNLQSGIENILNGEQNFLEIMSEDEEDYDSVILEKTYEAEDFRDVSVNIDVGNVRIVKASGDKVRVTVMTKKLFPIDKADCRIIGDKLCVDAQFPSAIFNDNRILVKVELPEIEYNKIYANVDAGNAVIDDVSAYSITLDVDAGNANISNAKAKFLSADVDAGNVGLRNTSGKSFNAKVDAGNVNLADGSLFDGSIDISADCGNITLALPRDLGYSIDYKVQMGSFNNDTTGDGSFQATFANKGTIYRFDRGTKIKLKADLGNITVKDE